MTWQRSFIPPPLPYAADALSPAISKETVTIHYERIFKAHADALHILLDGNQNLLQKSAYEVLRERSLPLRESAEIRFHAGAVFAHSLYFSSMHPSRGGCAEPVGRLARLIRRDIGSYGELCFRFREAALSLCGPGFLYIVLTPRGGRIQLISCRGADVPSERAGYPLLCMDLWEHAYFLDAVDDRVLAVNAFLSVADWEAAERRLLELINLTEK